MRSLIYCAVLSTAAATGASASSDDAWIAFRAEVLAACTALVEPPAPTAVQVSPFGSESYGGAIVTVIRDGVIERSLCIFDKISRKAELAALE